MSLSSRPTTSFIPLAAITILLRGRTTNQARNAAHFSRGTPDQSLPVTQHAQRSMGRRNFLLRASTWRDCGRQKSLAYGDIFTKSITKLVVSEPNQIYFFERGYIPDSGVITRGGTCKNSRAYERGEQQGEGSTTKLLTRSTRTHERKPATVGKCNPYVLLALFEHICDYCSFSLFFSPDHIACQCGFLSEHYWGKPVTTEISI